MDNTEYLLIYLLTGTGIGGEMHRVAAKIDGDLYMDEEMKYYQENDNLKKHLRLPNCNVILKIEEIEHVFS